MPQLALSGERGGGDRGTQGRGGEREREREREILHLFQPPRADWMEIRETAHGLGVLRHLALLGLMGCWSGEGGRGRRAREEGGGREEMGKRGCGT
jgi:hypothetical protein